MIALSNRGHLSASVVVLLTISAGILPLVLITAWQGTLLLTSRVNGPLLGIPSVWFGDLFVLPVFNVYALRLLRGGEQSEERLGPWLISFALAAIVGGYSHYEWIQDAFFGFIDPTPGTLSFAGWWHLAFTIAEMTLVYRFVWSFVEVAGGRDLDAARYGVIAWRVFLGYASLSIADFVVLHWFLLPRRGIADYKWSTAWEGLLVLPFWAVIFVIARVRSRAAGRHRGGGQ